MSLAGSRYSRKLLMWRNLVNIVDLCHNNLCKIVVWTELFLVEQLKMFCLRLAY